MREREQEEENVRERSREMGRVRGIRAITREREMEMIIYIKKEMKERSDGGEYTGYTGREQK